MDDSVTQLVSEHGGEMLPFRDPDVPLTEDQKILRKRVLHQIETEPGTFNMGMWDSIVLYPAFPFLELCGTTRCLGGWAVFFAGCPVTAEDHPFMIEIRAVQVLGLTREEYHFSESGDLFHCDSSDALAWFREMTEQ